jgi:hypothetical protein
VNFVIQKLKNKHTFLKKPQKVAKLSKAKFSCFEGTRGDKNQIFCTIATSGRNKIKFQSGQSYSYIMRKVWYHQI